MAAKKICVANQLAGAGKTTTAVNLAVCLALAEKKTLLVDSDPQADATAHLTEIGADPATNLYHVLTEAVPIREAVINTPCDFLKLLPAGTELFRADSRSDPGAGTERILREALAVLADEFEYVVLDTPSSLGFLTACSLAAADSLLLPLLCRPDAVSQLGYLLQLVVDVRDRLKVAFKISGVVLNRCSHLDEARQIISEESFAGIENIVLPVTIPVFTSQESIPEKRYPVILQDIMSEPAQRYFALTSLIAGTL